MKEKRKIVLLLEDDKDLNRGITFAFEKEGYHVCSAFTLLEARRLLEKHNLEFAIMDLNLPDGDGLELCKEIREKSNLPIIILTARDLEIDEVIGLDSGADDYITKPFSLSVLKARVVAILRRKGNQEEGITCSNGIQLNPKAMKIIKHGVEMECTVTEFKLLRYLMENKNQVLLKEQILANIWDQEGNFVDENTLPVNISRLRRRIEDDPTQPNCIQTVHGVGYIWKEK